MALVVRATTVTRYSGLDSCCFCLSIAGAGVWLIAGAATMPRNPMMERQTDAIFTVSSFFLLSLPLAIRPGSIARWSCGRPGLETGLSSPLFTEGSKDGGGLEGRRERSLCK